MGAQRPEPASVGVAAGPTAPPPLRPASLEAVLLEEALQERAFLGILGRVDGGGADRVEAIGIHGAPSVEEPVVRIAVIPAPHHGERGE